MFGEEGAFLLPVTRGLRGVGWRYGWGGSEGNSEANIFTLASVNEVIEDVRGDIRDYPALETTLRKFAPDVVFHLAAQPLVRRGYADPIGTYGTNVMGTVQVLEAVRQTPSVRAVVCVTTDKCYQNQEGVWPYR